MNKNISSIPHGKVPILLIAFNRPEKTMRVLNRILEYRPKELFISIDGPRNNEDLKKINLILETIRNTNFSFPIHIKQHKKNLGCKYGPLSGIDWFFEHVDEGIILEDDCLPYLPFFNFCSRLLSMYRKEEKIMHISGNNFQNGKKRGDINASYYFSNYTHSWGWATWKRSWILYKEAIKNFKEFKSKKQIQSIPIGALAQKYWLKNFQKNLLKTDSWDSLWMYAVWYHNGLAILPQQNLVQNIGFDADATHTKFDIIKQTESPVLDFKIIDPKELRIDTDAEIYTFNQLYKTNKIKRLFLFLKNKMPITKIIFLFKKMRFRLYPRYKIFNTYLFGKKFFVPDKSSFMFMYEEIFDKEIYKFKTEKDNPLIIDAGANIGLSIIYFKNKFKDAKIIAFEPDPYIFNFLEKNIKSQNFTDITLINKGLSNKETTANFYSEKADGGRIAQKEDTDSIIQVRLTTLSHFLDQETDLLKIDIEGSEVDVLKECKDKLKNVKNIFIEFHSLATKEQELNILLEILKEAGFRYYIEHVGINSKHPLVYINQYAGYDLQLNIWGYKNNTT